MSALLYLDDAYLRSFSARVTALDEHGAVALDRTAFYPTGGGQPHDTGLLGGERVTDVRHGQLPDGGEVAWHVLAGTAPPVGTEVEGDLDWDRRHALMRVHTALHVLCGVIWHRWATPVTGGAMAPAEGDRPPSARMDFEFDPLPQGFGATVEDLVNAELVADRPVEVSYLARREALADADLVRTKVALIPESVERIRVVDIVGLDRQADGGTHVASTGEVGRVRVAKTESKGRANKRIRIEVLDG
ncbi:MAG TPA: alanyl-tRNA editing protein [Acidimicrobiales bacterium]|nr:alanyl-tRNA editing protein [Acidimicrobiales bacterium]